MLRCSTMVYESKCMTTSACLRKVCTTGRNRCEVLQLYVTGEKKLSDLCVYLDPSSRVVPLCYHQVVIGQDNQDIIRLYIRTGA